MTIDKNSLFQLTPNEFEKLCAEILRAQGIERVELVGGPNDQGVDIIGEAKGQQIAVQVKHTRQLSPAVVRRIIDQVQASSYQPKQLVIMTSATISPSLRELIQKLSSAIAVRLIGQDEILRVLNDHPEIQRLQVEPAQLRTYKQRWELTLGLAGAFSSIVAGVLTSGLFFFVQPEKPQLQGTHCNCRTCDWKPKRP